MAIFHYDFRFIKQLILKHTCWLASSALLFLAGPPFALPSNSVAILCIFAADTVCKLPISLALPPAISFDTQHSFQRMFWQPSVLAV